ncbi:MAG: hypothetical protein IKA26_06915 [Alistipes sp.]|nr:hypothetical protein [Alistipes sp.]
MINNKRENEYIRPFVEVIDVACELGFVSSTGNLTYTGGSDGGWYEL